MRKILVCWLFVAVACQQTKLEPDEWKDGIPVAPVNGWTTLALNVDYTVQFPDSLYAGKSYRLRDANSFGDQNTLIQRKDESLPTLLYATFCDPSAYPCLLLHYTDSLRRPLPESVPFRNNRGQDAFLENRAIFTKDGKLLAVFYDGPEPDGRYTGRLYAVERSSNVLRQAGAVRFTEATRPEVLDILATLAPR
jgi:hypothetical protein